MPHTVKDWLLCGLIALCALGCGLVDVHLTGWCKGVDHLLSEAQTAAGNTQAATAQLPETIRGVNETISSLNKTAGQFNEADKPFPETMASIKEAADTSNDSSTEALDAIGSTVSLIADIRSQLDTVLPKAGATADAASRTLQALTRTSDGLTIVAGDAHAFLNDPGTKQLKNSATMFLDSYTRLGDGLTTATGHIDQRFFAPYSGTHPRLHTVWTFTSGALGLGSRVGEGAYYGIGAAHGQ